MRNKKRIKLPLMPSEKCIRALQHAIDTVGKDNWIDKTKALPELAKQIAMESREHNFEVPRNIYNIYLDSLKDEKYKVI